MRRSAPGEGLLLLNALLAVGRSAIALPRTRLRMCELPLLLLELGVRMEVRVLVDPPGIMAVRGHMQGWIRASLGRIVARLVLREWLRTIVSTTFESVDFARDDSFRAVLGLIRDFHDMAEPATVPGAPLQDFSCIGLWFGGGFLSVVLVAAFPLVVDSPDGHKLRFV